MEESSNGKCEYAPELPDELLDSIVGRLSSLVCFAAFRSVCTSWRSFFLQHYSHLIPPPPPWIILPDPNSSVSCRPTLYGLYQLHDPQKKQHQHQFHRFNIPDNYDSFGWSSGTWLIFVDGKAGKLRVWNPLSLIEFSLPFVRNQNNQTNLSYGKFHVSCAGPLFNKDEDVFVAVFHSSKNLVVIRLGDENWTNVDIDDSLDFTVSIHDLIFYRGNFYFLHHSGALFVCHQNYGAIKTIKLADPIKTACMRKPRPNAVVWKYYLVEVEGELMLVLRFILISDIWFFRVFKFDFAKKVWEFVDRAGLKGYSLYLSYCFGSIAARDVSGTTGIYFKYYHSASDYGQKDLQNHCLMVSDYLTKKPTTEVFAAVINLHRNSIHPVWIIPRHTK
ncbi:hypothetical protein Sjap_016615 [Stephania japonica]|uniref:KIB1-4 beta-propeller domain-containing protein n=1 Tax=Stephania japonica TaxID=461633 RepID=A0AAP0NSK0_9MAGN